jgi:hypothetical protein
MPNIAPIANSNASGNASRAGSSDPCQSGTTLKNKKGTPKSTVSTPNGAQTMKEDPVSYHDDDDLYDLIGALLAMGAEGREEVGMGSAWFDNLERDLLHLQWRQDQERGTP